MLVQALLVIATVIIVIGILIRLLKPEWLEAYLIGIGLLLGIPLTAAIILCCILRQIVRLLWMFSKPIGKAIVFVIVALILIPVTFVSSFVPQIGSRIQSINERIERSIGVSEWVSENRFIRSTMVEIVAAECDRELDFEREEEYREAFPRVKAQGKRKLALGESALSLFVGAVLLASQVTEFSLLQSRIHGITATVGIQSILLLIAVSILYRVSILEFLAYSGDEEFESIPEMDAALSYQKIVSQIAFIQLLNFLLVLGVKMVNTDRQVIRGALEDYYGDMTLYETLERAYEMRKEQSNDKD